MTKKEYNYRIGNEAKIAKATAKNARASLKYSTELGRELKGMKLKRAAEFLGNIITKKEFIPLRKYVKKMGHRKGKSISFTKTGRYPKRTAQIFLDLLNSVRANADYKGLNTENLIIKHVFASQGLGRIGYQPKGHISGKRRKRKATHIEIIVAEAS
ncbi:MAG: 50S ribosomal protein L22 [Candidatus Diapherotrites archaeon]